MAAMVELATSDHPELRKTFLVDDRTVCGGTEKYVRNDRAMMMCRLMLLLGTCFGIVLMSCLHILLWWL